MGLILTGVVNGMRPVGGVVEKGPRAGEVWNFISFEITDPAVGTVILLGPCINARIPAEKAQGKKFFTGDAESRAGRLG